MKRMKQRLMAGLLSVAIASSWCMPVGAAAPCKHKKLDQSTAETVVTVAATCTTDGEQETTGECLSCHETVTVTEKIKKLGHNYKIQVEDPKKPGKYKSVPNYNSDEYTHWEECTREGCGEKKSVSAHSFDKKASCGDLTCTKCGAEGIAHKWGKGKVDKGDEATCTEPGVMTYACTDKKCDGTATAPIEALGHAFATKWSKDANGHWQACTRKGCTEKQGYELHDYNGIPCEKKASCVVCKNSRKANQHTYELVSWDESGHQYACVAEGCEATMEDSHNFGKVPCGSKDVPCIVDGCEHKADVDHTWGTKPKETKKATCTEDGVMTYTCTVKGCKGTKTEPIPAGHTYKKYGKDENEHWMICSVCKDETEHEAHDYGDISCDKTAKCADCGNSRKKGQHAFVWDHADAEGHWYVCAQSSCRETKLESHDFGDAKCEDENVACQTEGCGIVLEKKPHEYGKEKVTRKATCTVDGEKTLTCTVKGCGAKKTEIIEAHGEAIENPDKPALEPTCTKAGKSAEMVCSTCGKVVKKQATIKKLGHDEQMKFNADGHWEECVRCGETTSKMTKHSLTSDGTACKKCDWHAVVESDYYIDVFREGPKLIATIVAPEDADRDTMYTYFFYNSDDPYENEGLGCMPAGAWQPFNFRPGYYDCYKVLLWDEEAGWGEGVVMGEGTLAKPISSEEDCFEISGVTLTVGELGRNNRYSCTLNGLDFDTYNYTLEGKNAGYFISSENVNIFADDLKGDLTLYATRTTETDDCFLQETSVGYVVPVGDEPGEEEDPTEGCTAYWAYNNVYKTTPFLYWDTPAAYKNSDRVTLYLSADGGETWEKMMSSKPAAELDKFSALNMVKDEKTYNMAKFEYRTGDQVDGFYTADITLSVTKKAGASTPDKVTAELENGQYTVTYTGMTPNALYKVTYGNDETNPSSCYDAYFSADKDGVLVVDSVPKDHLWYEMVEYSDVVVTSDYCQFTEAPGASGNILEGGEEPEVDLSLTSLDVLDITQKDIFDETTNTAFVQSDIYGVLVKAESAAQLTVTAEKTTYDDEGELTYTAGEAIPYNEKLGGYIVPLSEAYEDYDSEYTQTVTITAASGSKAQDYTVTIKRECDKKIHDLFQKETYAYDMGEGGELAMNYLVYYPSNFDESKEYPVVLVLHGSGQMEYMPGYPSTDMIVKRNQAALAWAKDSEKGINECIVVAPQISYYMTPDTPMWGGGAMLMPFGLAAYDLLENEFIAKDYVDEDRVYVTGLSLGGVGTYAMIGSHPETFAGAIIACGATYEDWYGGYDYSALEPLSGSIYLTHAQGDPEVDFMFYEQSTAGMEAAGIEYETKVWTEQEIFYPHAHYAWTPTYADETIRSWLFEQVREEQEPEEYTAWYEVDDYGRPLLRTNVPYPEFEDDYYTLVELYEDADGKPVDWDMDPDIYGDYIGYDYLNVLMASCEPGQVIEKIRVAAVADGVEVSSVVLDQALEVTEPAGDEVVVEEITVTEMDDGRLLYAIALEGGVEENASYALVFRSDAGNRRVAYLFEMDGMLATVRDPKHFVGAGTFYVVRSTAVLDEDGNVALTYTPEGDGYYHDPEAGEEPDDLIGKNGYDVAISVSGGALKATISAPATASEDTLYTIYFFQTDGDKYSYITNCRTNFAYGGISGNATYDAVRILDSKSATDVDDQTVLAEWELDALIVSSTKAFDLTGPITMIIDADSKGDEAYRSVTFTGLDFAKYPYTLTNTELHRAWYLSESPLRVEAKYLNNSMTIKAREAGMEGGVFWQKESNPYTIDGVIDNTVGGEEPEENPYAVTNVRFEEFNNDPVLVWDNPESRPDGLKYELRLTVNGKKEHVWSSGSFANAGDVCRFDLMNLPGTITLQIVSILDGEEVAVVNPDLTIICNGQTLSEPISVTVTDWNEEGFWLDIADLYPVGKNRVCFVYDGEWYEWVEIWATAEDQVVTDKFIPWLDANSTDLEKLYIDCEAWTDYKLSADGKTMSYTWTKLGDETQISVKEEVNPYAVTNIRFEETELGGGQLVWDNPEEADGMAYLVEALQNGKVMTLIADGVLAGDTTAIDISLWLGGSFDLRITTLYVDEVMAAVEPDLTLEISEQWEDQPLSVTVTDWNEDGFWVDITDLYPEGWNSLAIGYDGVGMFVGFGIWASAEDQVYEEFIPWQNSFNRDLEKFFIDCEAMTDYEISDDGKVMSYTYTKLGDLTRISVAGDVENPGEPDIVIDEYEVQEAMTSLKGEYYEGRHWTNDDYYEWNGGIFRGGYGCAAFTFILSDEAFGDLPARMIENGNFKFEDVRIGDILRVDGNTHSVIVIGRGQAGLVVAEGNYNSSIHWGREFTAKEVEAADYILTRYPG